MLANLKPMAPDDETAEELATNILIWLADQPKLMERFLKLSGIEADKIRSMLGVRSFYAGLTGFLMSHEPTMLDFCADTNTSGEWVSACHYHLADA